MTKLKYEIAIEVQLDAQIELLKKLEDEIALKQSSWFTKLNFWKGGG